MKRVQGHVHLMEFVLQGGSQANQGVESTKAPAHMELTIPFNLPCPYLHPGYQVIKNPTLITATA